MLSRKIISFAIMVAFTLAAGMLTPAQAQFGRWARLKNYLALTEAQTTQLNDLLKKHRESAEPLRQQLLDKREALRTALDAAEPNAAAVGQIVIAQHGLRSQLRDLNAKLQADFAAILTPEQKARLEDLKKLRPGRWRQS